MKLSYNKSSTNIYFSSNEEELLSIVYSLNKSISQIIIFTDATVSALYAASIQKLLKKLEIQVEIIVFPSGENTKTIDHVIQGWHKLSELKADRSSLLISLGGGVISDLTGFLASTYMRGLDFISIPTTLLGMVDASIGGKTGIDHLGQKNLIGTFYDPLAIYINQNFLQTLPIEEFSSGLAEIIKAAVISGNPLFVKLEKCLPNLFKLPKDLLQEIIFESAKVKIGIVEEDQKETGKRAILNYGHTFGHAIESLMHFQIAHGAAVSIGMSCSAYVAKKLGFVDKNFIQRQDTLCLQAKLPIKLPNLPIQRLIDQIKTDKKNFSQKITLILPEKIGKVISLPNISERLIYDSLAEKKENDVIY